ncbi:alanine and glycine-rich protein-like [Punica granatum]|uniref:Alanine and glycine-rich protein-like n=1 Tax=Punica granatum TaxID=22663 RepID=A0A6P8DQP0_PUNGR|nr:alanine and glycine-rich protein-like [Punica granatum]
MTVSPTTPPRLFLSANADRRQQSPSVELEAEMSISIGPFIFFLAGPTTQCTERQRGRSKEMDGTGLALIIFCMALLFIRIVICDCLVRTEDAEDAAAAAVASLDPCEGSKGGAWRTGEANDAAAAGASSDPSGGTKDGNMEVMGKLGEAIVEIAAISAEDRHGSSITVGCCCGGGGGVGGGGGCGGPGGRCGGGGCGGGGCGGVGGGGGGGGCGGGGGG